jgi:hypothetical protein
MRLLAACLLVASSLSASARAASLPPSINIPGFGTIKTSASGDDVTLTFPSGFVAKLTGTYNDTTAFNLCGKGSGRFVPLANTDVPSASAKTLAVETPTICYLRPAPGAPTELTFVGRALLGAGLLVSGSVRAEGVRPLVTLRGRLENDWNLSVFHRWLTAEALAKLSLSNLELVITSTPLSDKGQRLAPGVHVVGTMSLAEEARKQSPTANATYEATRLLGAITQVKLPVRMGVTASSISIDAKVQGELKPKAPFVSTGVASLQIQLLGQSASPTARVVLHVPLGYHFPEQTKPTSFVGQLEYKTSPVRFAGSLRATGSGIIYPGVNVDDIGMSMALEPAKFAKTYLPSEVAFTGKTSWSGGAWTLTARANAEGSIQLFRSSLASTSTESFLTTLPLPANWKSRVPPFLLDVPLSHAEVYFAPRNVTAFDHNYKSGIGAWADLQGKYGGKASLRVFWEPTATRVKATWSGFDKAQLTDALVALVGAKRIGLSEAEIRTFVDGYSLDAFSADMQLPSTGSAGEAFVRFSWMGRYNNQLFSGIYNASATLKGDESFRQALARMATEWLEKKARGLLR